MVTNIFAQYTNMNISARNTPNWIFLHEEKKIKQQCSFDKISATTILEVIVGPFSAAPLRLSSHQYGGGNKSIVLNNWTLPFYKISAITILYHTPCFATMLLSSVPELQHFRTHKLMVTLICLSVQFQSDSSWKPILRQDRWASQVWSTSQVCFCIVFTIQDFNICLSRAAWHRKRPDQHFFQESCSRKCLFADTQCCCDFNWVCFTMLLLKLCDCMLISFRTHDETLGFLLPLIAAGFKVQVSLCGLLTGWYLEN